MEVNELKSEPIKKPRGLVRKVLWALLIFICAFLVWFNGPGFRWIAPKIAEQYLTPRGFTIDVRLGGTLLQGIEINELNLSSNSGSVEFIKIQKLVTRYRPSHIWKGQIDEVSGSEFRINLREKEKEEPSSKPLDLESISKILSQIQENLQNTKIDLSRINLSIKKTDTPIIEITGGSLVHQKNSSRYQLSSQSIKFTEGRNLPPQKIDILWENQKIKISKIDILPGLGMRSFQANLPNDGMLTADAIFDLRGAVLKLDVGAGLSDLRLDLIEGKWDFSNPLNKLGIGPALKGKLSSLSLEARDFYPDWKKTIGSAEFMIEKFAYQKWSAPELIFRADIQENQITTKAVGTAIGSPFEINAVSQWDRKNADSLGIKQVSGDANFQEIGAILQTLDKNLSLSQDFNHFPKSNLSGNWQIELDDLKVSSATMDLVLKAEDIEIEPFKLESSWQDGKIQISKLSTKGLLITGYYDSKSKFYQLSPSLDYFDTSVLVPWLRGVGLPSANDASLSFKAELSGDLNKQTHKGEVDGLAGSIYDKQTYTFGASELRYDWPRQVELKELLIETESSKISLSAYIAEQILNLQNFSFHQNDVKIAHGMGKIPFPKDFDFSNFPDNKPIDFQLKTTGLELEQLHPWVSSLAKIASKGQALLDVKLGGTWAEPILHAKGEIKNASLTEKDSFPKMNAFFELHAQDKIANLTSNIDTKEFAPAVGNLEMNFLPLKWLHDPKSIFTESIKGKLVLPKIDLSKLPTLPLSIKSLQGITEGQVDLTGTVTNPKIEANLSLTSGTVEFQNGALPEIRGLKFLIKANSNEISLDGKIADVSAGVLSLNGKCALDLKSEKKLGKIDLRVKGQGLPIIRNDSLIIRSNADLVVSGVWETALISGEIDLVDSIFYRDIELLPIGKPFLGPQAASLPKIDVPSAPKSLPFPFSNWTTDIAVKNSDPILIRGNLGNGSVDVGMRVSGKCSDPRPDGRIRLANAVARLPLTNVEIREGYLLFSPQNGFDPTLEIRARAEARPYRIEAYAYGRLSDPQLLLSSNPPLPETEIMTLLATGTTSQDINDSQAASALGLQLLFEEMRKGRFILGNYLRPIFGIIENVDFSLAEKDPYDSDTYRSATIRLGSKWYLSTAISDQGDQRIMAIWRLRFR